MTMAQAINSVESLLHEELKDMYDMEKQLTKALPKMARNAASEELRAALEEHLEATNKQINRLEQVFDLIGHPAKGKPCAGMKGLIEEGKKVMEQEAAEPFADAAMIAAAQRVEHYEMAAYGTARTLAQLLGNTEAAELLQESLDEEKDADEKLTEICESLLQGHAEETIEEIEESEEQEEAIGTRRRPMGVVQSAQRGGSARRAAHGRRRAS
jgi:ferritin-like metal-binding protein YciE